MRSPLEHLLYILGLSPSDEKYLETAEYFEHYSLSDIFDFLHNLRNSGLFDPEKLIQFLDLPENIESILIENLEKQTDNIWLRLRMCGSDIKKEFFTDIGPQKEVNENEKRGEVTEKEEVNEKEVTEEADQKIDQVDFTKRLHHLWSRDIALRRLEWHFLRVVHIYHRDEIIDQLSLETTKILLKSDNLLEILDKVGNDMTYCIGRSLSYKLHLNNVPLYKMCRCGLKLSMVPATRLMAKSLQKDGTYDTGSLYEKMDHLLKDNIESDE